VGFIIDNNVTHIPLHTRRTTPFLENNSSFKNKISEIHSFASTWCRLSQPFIFSTVFFAHTRLVSLPLTSLPIRRMLTKFNFPSYHSSLPPALALLSQPFTERVNPSVRAKEAREERTHKISHTVDPVRSLWHVLQPSATPCS
jgi:hypothetical protein